MRGDIPGPINGHSGTGSDRVAMGCVWVIVVGLCFLAFMICIALFLDWREGVAPVRMKGQSMNNSHIQLGASPLQRRAQNSAAGIALGRPPAQIRSASGDGTPFPHAGSAAESRS